MPGPAPKPAVQRRRRNRVSTAMVISAPAEPTRLPFDTTAYCPEVQLWLRSLEESPMAPEWDASDVMAIMVIAKMFQRFWTEQMSPNGEATYIDSIRLLLVENGLTPLSRRRLQWEIERGETAAERTATRRAAKRTDDPRLKVV